VLSSLGVGVNDLFDLSILIENIILNCIRSDVCLTNDDCGCQNEFNHGVLNEVGVSGRNKLKRED